MDKQVLRNQKGVSLVLLALSITVLFGFGAVAIDIGHLYNVKNQLQAAADAAALAGAAALNNDKTDITQKDARDAAQRMGLKNVADVAYNDIKSAGLTVDAGNPIPVYLDRNEANTYTPPGAKGEDIVVGYWDGAWHDVDRINPINAVMVTVHRDDDTGGRQEHPRAQNWFAKVFALLGANYDFSSITAVAIAAKEPLKIAPIVVNEYWRSSEITQHPGSGPYPDNVHLYPSSFVRQKEVASYGVAQTVTSPAFGYTFAILGNDANSNYGSTEPNGYLNLDYRSDYYYGGPITATPVYKKGVLDHYDYSVTKGIYTAIDNTGSCSTACNSYFLPSPPGDTNEPNGIQNQNTTTGVNYLVNGYPPTRLPPTAIYEIKRIPDTLYTNSPANKKFASITSVYNDRYNLKSDCPHAVVYYFRTSGKPPLNYDDNTGSGKTVIDHYPAGTRFMAMVYDGTHTGGTTDNPANYVDKLLTIVGYVPIEVDGYSTSLPSLHAGNDEATYRYNQRVLDPKDGNTMYGHALSDIIQPNPASPRGGCEVLGRVNAAQNQYGYVHLVDPNLRYGMANHSQQ